MGLFVTQSLGMGRARGVALDVRRLVRNGREQHGRNVTRVMRDGVNPGQPAARGAKI